MKNTTSKKNLRVMATMVRHLEDDYEVEQLNPVYAKNPRTGEDYSSDDIVKAAESLKENASLRLRVAFMEAVIDTVVEDAIEENPEITTEEIHEEIDPAIEKAVNLALIPSQVKNMVDTCIIRHRKKRDPHMVLLEKCAIFMTQSMTYMEEEKTVINDDVQEGVAGEVQDATCPETEHPAEGGTVTTIDSATVEPEEVEIKEELPVPAEASMRMLAASTVNARKARALVIRNIAGTMSSYMLHELKYCLPEKFLKKYGK